MKFTNLVRLVFGCCLVAGASAQPVCEPGLTNKFGGGITATYTANSALQVVGMGSSFALINVANPASPFFVNKVELGGQVQGIASPASLAYWVLTPTRLYNINAAAFPNPQIVSSSDGYRFLQTPALSSAKSVAVNGDFQYVVGSSGTHIFRNGACTGWRDAIANDVTVARGFGWATGSTVFRVGHGSDGRPLGLYSGMLTQYQGTTYPPYGILGDGNYLYVISVSNTQTPQALLTVFSIADGDYHLTVIAQRVFTLTAQSTRARLTKSGNALYVCFGAAGTHWFNISNPLNPVYDDFATTFGEDRNMSVFGTTAYIAKGDTGLRTANVSAGTEPLALGLFQSLPGNARDFDSFSNAYAVVADGYAGMSVVNIQANPLAPTRVGSAFIGGFANRVSTGNFLAFFTNGTGITAVSYLSPQFPSVVGSFNLPNGEVALDVLVYGQKLLVTSSTTLYSYDVSTNVANPPLIDTYNHGAFLAGTQMTLGSGKVFIATDAGVERFTVNISTGVITALSTLVTDPNQTVVGIASRFADVPPGTEYLAIITREYHDGSGGFDIDTWRFRAHLYAPSFPPGQFWRYGTWSGASVPVESNLSTSGALRGSSMHSSLLNILIDDTMYYVDINNLFTPLTLGTADVGYTDGGSAQATANAVYAACGHGGLATLRRTFNSAPVGRVAYAYPTPVCGGDTVFTAAFAGSPLPSTFRWHNVAVLGSPQVFDGVQPDGSVIFGSATGQLAVSEIAPGFPAFVCHGENLCGEGVSSTDFFDLGPCASQCDSIDFNNDTSLFDPQDIEAFLSVYSEGPCVPVTATCNDIDFNNDTSLFDPCDFSSFLVLYSEGPCTHCGV